MPKNVTENNSTDLPLDSTVNEVTSNNETLTEKTLRQLRMVFRKSKLD